jgi:hypothetical protein
MAEKQCSKCGKSFGCTSPTPGCWCEQYVLTGEALQQLRSEYADCLCPACLAQYGDAKPATNETPLH